MGTPDETGLPNISADRPGRAVAQPAVDRLTNGDGREEGNVVARGSTAVGRGVKKVGSSITGLFRGKKKD